MPSPIQFDRPPVISLSRVESAPQIEENGPSFGDLFKKVLSDTSGLQDNARGMIEAYLRGEPVELHQVMAASEEASISLELLVELRNKLTDAYRAVINIQ
jgi:flagellar hook-basal body complex protein FliE